jgi:hypothetical protein
MNKPIDIMLTKEAFEGYSKRLREERAKEFGMTLEEWDNAVVSGDMVQKIVHEHISGSME